jgi:urease accessory protein
MYAVILPSETRDARAVGFQRSIGTTSLEFAAEQGVSRACRVYQHGSMKVRFPYAPRALGPEAVLINISGGLTGGDRQTLEAELGPAAQATITTQACEKIYRSLGDDAVVESRLVLKPGARLHWLPQPAILFNGARLRRTLAIDLADDDATILALEAVIFGRTAMREIVTQGALDDTITIRRGGRLIHAERFALKDENFSLLAKPAVLAGHHAMASLRYVATDASTRIEEMHAILAEIDDGIAAVSAWNGLMLVRCVAADGYRLTRMLMRILSSFAGASVPRAWTL